MPLVGPPPLQTALTALADSSPEQRLLSHTALIAAYARAGRKPAPAGDAPPAAAPDALPECSARAADLLEQVMAERAKGLVAEWLATAAKAKRRVPHRLLPDLLELARRDKSLREIVAALVDERGRWLIAQNADWQFAATEAVDDSEWDIGTAQKRLLVLRHVRQTDPPRGRELLQRTWKDDPADERAEFLKEFAASLSMADEPLLESLLDDRSKQVRAVAADLLGRLRESQLVRRMTERVLPLLTFSRGMIRGLKLEVTLPAELDKSALRDGIEKTPPSGIGEKQWWLRQMLSFVPLATWTAASGQRPADVLAMAGKTEYAEALIAGFTAAAERNADPRWLDSLLREGFERTGRLSGTLVLRLPANQFLGLAADVLIQKHITLVGCSDLVYHDNIPLDLATARRWVRTVARLAASAAISEQVILHQLPERSAMRLPPGVRAEVQKEWDVTAEPWNRYRNGVDKLLKTLERREQIEKEFMS